MTSSILNNPTLKSTLKSTLHSNLPGLPTKFTPSEQAAVLMLMQFDEKEIDEMVYEMETQFDLTAPHLLDKLNWYCRHKKPQLLEHIKQVLVGAMLAMIVSPLDNLDPLMDEYRELLEPIEDKNLYDIGVQIMVDIALSKNGPMYKTWGSVEIADTLIQQRAKQWMSLFFKQEKL